MNLPSDTDRLFLTQCLELAAEAVQAGDDAYGSVLVLGGKVIATDRNRSNTLNTLHHPEIELARWALDHLNLEERQAATLYTTGEHCPMCAAAHGWARIGNLVFLHSTQQQAEWLSDMGKGEAPIELMSASQIIKQVNLRGPFDGELLEQIKGLHRQSQAR